MKKYLFLLLVLCLVVFSFASCKSEKTDLPDETKETTAGTNSDDKPEEPKEPTDAAMLFEMIDKRMESLKSYETEHINTVTYYVYGTKVSAETKGKLVDMLDIKESPFYYEYVSTVVKMEQMSYEQKMTSFVGYMDGKVYLMNDDGNPKQKICADMSAEDFLVYIADSRIEDFDFMDCKNSEFTKNEDGTWTLNLSGYTKKSLDYLLEELDFEDFGEGLKVLDVKFCFNADAQYRATSLRYEFVFDVEEGSTDVPEIIIIENYSKFDEVDRSSITVDTEGYKGVTDVKVIKSFGDKLEELYDLENGKFTLNINQTAKVNGTVVSEQKEKDVVLYGKENGSYFYNIEADADNEKITWLYKNGVQTITVDGETQTATSTDSQAKKTVNDLINNIIYDVDNVSNIEKVSDNEYKLEIAYADEDLYAAVFEQLGVEDGYAKQVITFVMENEKITKITSEMDARGTLTYDGVTSDINLLLVTEHVFEYTQDAGTNL